MGKILVNLCLTDIPKEYIKEVTFKDGSTKKYLNIVVAERRETDKDGNDYTVYAYKPKEHRDDGTIWLGKGKTMMPKEASSPASPANPSSSPQAPIDPNSDLPF